MAFPRFWMIIYLCRPGFLYFDQGSNFISKEFNEYSEAKGITVMQAPIKSPGTMSYVEIYHALLSSYYTKHASRFLEPIPMNNSFSFH